MQIDRRRRFTEPDPGGSGYPVLKRRDFTIRIVYTGTNALLIWKQPKS